MIFWATSPAILIVIFFFLRDRFKEPPRFILIRNIFTTEIQDIDNYISWLKINANKYKVGLNSHDELDMFQTYRWGYAFGLCIF